MNPDIFAEWLKRQNYRVYQTESGHWYNQGPGVYQSFPFFQAISPGFAELKNFFRVTRAIALRYSTPIEQPIGKISYHVIREKPFVLDQLPKKVRYDLQHGLQYASYQQISFEQMTEDGWKIRVDTLKRQGRASAESRDHWQKLCLTASGLDGFEAWGAVRDQELLACMFCVVVGNCCQILYHQSLSEHLKFGINNTLAYFVTNEMLGRDGIETIFYGLHSLDAPASVDEFKFRMGFKAKPVRQNIVFNPWAAPLVNKASHQVVKTLLKQRPGNATLAKTEGMIRFYLEGKVPLEQQNWPEILLEQKDAILAQVNHQ